jgi:hypothetical protein
MSAQDQLAVPAVQGQPHSLAERTRSWPIHTWLGPQKRRATLTVHGNCHSCNWGLPGLPPQPLGLSYSATLAPKPTSSRKPALISQQTVMVQTGPSTPDCVTFGGHLHRTQGWWPWHCCHLLMQEAHNTCPHQPRCHCTRFAASEAGTRQVRKKVSQTQAPRQPHPAWQDKADSLWLSCSGAPWPWPASPA